MAGPVNHNAMATVGYTVPWSATAGREVNLHLSSARPITQVTILRLDTPEPETQSWDIDPVDPQPGRRDLAAGSYVFVDSTDLKTLDRVRSIAFELYLTRNSGFRTIMVADAFWIGLRDGRLSVEWNGRSLVSGETIPVNTWLELSINETSEGTAMRIKSGDTLAPYCFEDHFEQTALGRVETRLLFGWNGDPDHLKLNARYANFRLETAARDLNWLFPTRLPRNGIPSTGPAQSIYLQVRNLPTFCTRSMRWDGSSYDPKFVPSHYDAIHCHDDDMGAADWPVSYRAAVPDGAQAGVYAFQVHHDGGFERIIFFVASTDARAPLIFLVPTATYLAYANEFLPEQLFPWQCEDRGHRFAVDNNLRSLYDYHSDLSGVSICSCNKPKTTIRDDYEYPLCGCPHNLPVDLHLLRFCHRNGIRFDLVTDHDLHARGVECLKGHHAVVTGSHPEYMSIEMEKALRQFAVDGGSIAYLGGNGFAATVAIQDDLMELRRSSLEAGRTWDGSVAEQMLALTNEPGGLLRNRGRGEYSLVGGGISLMGFDRAQPYTRTEASHQPNCKWLFEGVQDEVFGNGGIVLGGAVGYEVDATDSHLGTSPDTIVIARATGFNEHFFQDITRWYEGGETELQAKRCAEMTIRFLANGGLIFSASSVAWCGALPSDDQMNDVGRLTLNLLEHLSVSQSGKSGQTAAE